MLIAINTLRDYKLYKSIRVHNDASLQQTENNRWIAPKSLIKDYGEYKQGEEVEMIYIEPKSYFKTIKGKEKEILVSSYFRCAKNNSGVKFKENNKNHERVQNFIFNYLLNNKDKIKFKISKKIEKGLSEDFYYIDLNDLKPDFSRLDFEITLKDSDVKKRADIFFPINKKKDIFGKGICIEIQLSPQSYEKTEERSLHRAYLGLSTIWIRNKDLEIDDKQIFLTNEELEILPYLHILNKANEKATEIIRLEYERQGILIDNKIAQVKEELRKLTIAGQLCPSCKIGVLEVIKPNEHNNVKNKFLGCKNFPNCRFSVNLE